MTVLRNICVMPVIPVEKKKQKHKHVVHMVIPAAALITQRSVVDRMALLEGKK